MELHYTARYNFSSLSKTILAAILKKDKCEKLSQIVFNDVTPLSIGMSDAEGVFKVFIKRNTPIPTENVQDNWCTKHDNQENAKIEVSSFFFVFINDNVKVFEGERAMAEDNVFLGKFVLEGLPLKPAGEAKLKHTFTLDADGILTVKSVSICNGVENGTTIKHRQGHLTEEAVDLLVDEARKYKEEDKANAAQASDRRFQQIKAEQKRNQAVHEHNVLLLAERKKQYTEELEKRDKEFESMQNNVTKMVERARKENREESEELKQKLEKNEKRYANEVKKYEDKLEENSTNMAKMQEKVTQTNTIAFFSNV